MQARTQVEQKAKKVEILPTFVVSCILSNVMLKEYFQPEGSLNWVLQKVFYLHGVTSCWSLALRTKLNLVVVLVEASDLHCC